MPPLSVDRPVPGVEMARKVSDGQWKKMLKKYAWKGPRWVGAGASFLPHNSFNLSGARRIQSGCVASRGISNHRIWYGDFTGRDGGERLWRRDRDE